MPCFEFFCSNCKIIFEELLNSSESKIYVKSHPCKKCKKSAKRIPSAANFNFAWPKGRPVQGTGVHGQSGVASLDYPSLDMAVGRSAERKWQNYNARKTKRDKARKEFGTNYIATHGNSLVPLNNNQLETRSKAMSLYKRAVAKEKPKKRK